MKLIDWTVTVTCDAEQIDDNKADALCEDLELALADFRNTARKLFIKHDIDSARIAVR